MSSRSHPLNSTDTTKMEKIMSDLMKNNDELPKGWEWKRLGEIAEVVAGNPAPQGEEYFRDGRYPFLRVQDMGRLGNDSYIYKTHDYINDKAVQSLRLFPKGSVLFTKSGASTLLNQRAILGRDMFVVSHIAATIPHDGIMSEWLYYWLKTVDFNKLAHATTLPSLPLSKAKDIHIPIAPPVEQKLIVSEIEKQFSRLDEAVAALKRVRASLKRYKASVLKAAVEGKLTEEWRKQNTNVEPADKLLKRILAERKKKWEEANSKKKYKEPAAPDTSSLPDLPKGWVWINFVRLASDMKNSIKRGPFGSAIKKAFFVQKGYKVYEQQNAIYNNHKLGNYYINEEKYNELIDFTVKPCDFIISCSGTIGKIAQIPESAEKGIINQALLKITIDNKLVLSKYFLYLFKSDVFQKMFLKDIRGTAMKNIASVEDLKLIPVALPPLHEQTTIVEEIESRLSVAEEIEETIDINLKRTERLRQAILKKAFSGKLITQ